MCGITGFFQSKRAISGRDEEVAYDMCRALNHRGPDTHDIWKDDVANLLLGHNRLAILDLSEAGHQPMLSYDGDFCIVFNGEIYNHLELRRQLNNNDCHIRWRSHSDTETLLVCIEQWGLEKTLKAIVGMFAFALWDRKKKILTLARDRIGEKPLYYGWQNSTFMFGSELKALKKHPDFQGEIDRNALSLFLRHNCVPAPYSIYKGIKKLPPGCFVQLHCDGNGVAKEEFQSYWSFFDVVRHGQLNPFEGAFEGAERQLHCLLAETVKGQMLSDVPLGAFLSGGVDSSLIVALMQEQSSLPIQTYTIGFEEKQYNEAKDAARVAAELGTQHTELYLSATDALNIIPQLPSIYCEPFSDSSQIPTYLVSKLASEHVTVSLSGDGGDEVFGGYNRYLSGMRVWGRIQCLPHAIRRMLANILQKTPPALWDKLFGWIGLLLPSRLNIRNVGYKLHKLAGVLSVTTPYEFYRYLTSHWQNPTEVVLQGAELETNVSDHSLWGIPNCFEHQMMAMDTVSYLPNDILVKVDRAAMACSLETRVPFLDHRVVEFAWSLPLEYKIKNGVGKRLLRGLLYKYVPRDLIERPKAGFTVPLDMWLKNELREWAEDLLSVERLRIDGFFNVQVVRKMWADFLKGKNNSQYHLWSILMFQAWLQEGRR